MCHMANKLKIDFAPFVPLITRFMDKQKRKYPQFEEIVERITKIDIVELFKQNMTNTSKQEQKPRVSGFDFEQINE